MRTRSHRPSSPNRRRQAHARASAAAAPQPWKGLSGQGPREHPSAPPARLAPPASGMLDPFPGLLAPVAWQPALSVPPAPPGPLMLLVAVPPPRPPSQMPPGPPALPLAQRLQMAAVLPAASQQLHSSLSWPPEKWCYYWSCRHRSCCRRSCRWSSGHRRRSAALAPWRSAASASAGSFASMPSPQPAPALLPPRHGGPSPPPPLPPPPAAVACAAAAAAAAAAGASAAPAPHPLQAVAVPKPACARTRRPVPLANVRMRHLGDADLVHRLLLTRPHPP
mmetsp:Transcript_27498/g.75625  ORF Transcript_27498/g.75625 Transcript_27498/m.75625 type:complete len:279 (-) Transcript_27498:609-1445(-)